MTLHWGIAIAIACEFGIGLRLLHMHEGLERASEFQLHRSLGFAILLLSIARLWVRLRVFRPAPAGDTSWAKWMAEAVHWCFYIVMIGAPLTGWFIISTAKRPMETLLFGFIHLPQLPIEKSAQPSIHTIAEQAHWAIAMGGIALLALHIAGILRHHVLLKDRLIERMTPFRRPGTGTILGLLALLTLAVVIGRYMSGPVWPHIRELSSAY
jgi:cytochrome b561